MAHKSVHAHALFPEIVRHVSTYLLSLFTFVKVPH
jgi:hypothetical protein